MSWRPDNWENPHLTKWHGAIPCTDGCDVEVWEDGADAMLEALKKQGAWLNAGQTLCDLNNVAIIPYKSKGGWLVFIKEE